MIEQFIIAVTGLSAVWFSQSSDPSKHRYACLWGLAGEPFWFYSAWKADQWGIMVLAIVYALGWSRGFYNYWIVKNDY